MTLTGKKTDKKKVVTVKIVTDKRMAVTVRKLVLQCHIVSVTLLDLSHLVNDGGRKRDKLQTFCYCKIFCKEIPTILPQKNL